MSVGGHRGVAWAAWGLGAAFYAYAFFQRVAPSIMVAELMQAFALGGALLGTLSATYFYAYAAVQIPVGLLLDRFGARRLLIGATALAAAGSLLFALAGGLALALVGRALVGAAVGVAFIATLKLATVWFPPERFGLISGLTLAAGVLGGILAQAPLAALVQALGWRGAMVVAAILAFALLAAMVLVLREPEAAVGSPARARGGMLGDLGRVVATAEVWLLTLFAGCTGAPILALAGLWLVPYLAQAQGLARAEAGLVASLMLAAWALGGPAAGWFAERVGRPQAMVAGAAISTLGLATLCLWPTPPLALILLVSVLLGLAGGAMIVAYAHTRAIYGAARTRPPWAWSTARCS